MAGKMSLRATSEVVAGVPYLRFWSSGEWPVLVASGNSPGDCPRNALATSYFTWHWSLIRTTGIGRDSVKWPRPRRGASGPDGRDVEIARPWRSSTSRREAPGARRLRNVVGSLTMVKQSPAEIKPVRISIVPKSVPKSPGVHASPLTSELAFSMIAVGRLASKSSTTRLHQEDDLGAGSEG